MQWQGPRLDSWKEIARHLGRDVSTAMRWERERGLPVHRPPGAKRAGVFAYQEELDAWLRRQPPSETDSARTAAEVSVQDPITARQIAVVPTPEAALVSPVRSWRVTAWVAATFLAAAAGILTITSSMSAVRAPVSTMTIAGNELQARDAAGRLLWVHRFAAATALERPTGRWVYVGDLDRDQHSEVVVAVKVVPVDSGPIVDQLLCFSADGVLRWTRIPDTHLRFANGEYAPPWVSEDLIAFDSGGERFLAWAIRHFTWWPSMVVAVDAKGDQRGRFVNSGWIRSLAVTPDGRALMAGGITNANRAHFLALLDPNHLAGSSPEAPGSPYVCLDCGTDGPVHYFVFPRTDVSTHSVFPPIHAPALHPIGGGIAHVRISQNSEPHGAEVLYELSSNDVVERARATDQFWDWHRQLEADGLIKHDDQTCPLRGALEVRHWTPAGGWQTRRVPSG